jgi:hypothetical protein
LINYMNTTEIKLFKLNLNLAISLDIEFKNSSPSYSILKQDY